MHILITGASQGIGRALARRLAREGHRLSLGYYQHEAEAVKLRAELRAAGCVCEVFAADLSREEDCRLLVREARAAGGPIEALVNNAGRAFYGLLQDSSREVWEQLYALHVLAAASLCREVLPDFLQLGHGVVLNMSSLWGEAGAACEAAYAASKGALNALTRSLAKEWLYSNIRVNALAAGAVDTAMCGMLSAADRAALEEELPLGRLAKPEEVAELAAFLLSDKSAYMTGEIVRLSGGWQLL